MKLFHTENGKESVYVQLEDIMRIFHSEECIPASVFNQVFSGVVIVTDDNRFDFVRFDEEHEVKFFKELEFVIDYDQYKDLSDEELNKEYQKLAARANELAEKWNAMSPAEREQHIEISREHENLCYMLQFLSEVYAVKHGKRSMPFPDFVQVSPKPKKSWFRFWRKDVK